MAQSDFVIDSQTALASRTELSQSFQALASQNSGTTAPTTTYAYMWWYETDTNLLKMRNSNNNGWINVAYVDQASGAWRVLDDTQVTNTSGTQTGLLGGQAQSVWNTGTGTIESLISPAQLKASIQTHVPDKLGEGQTWQNMAGSRSNNVQYQNTTGKPIMVFITGGAVSGTTSIIGYAGTASANLIVGRSDARYGNPSVSFIVPDQHYYKVSAGAGITYWTELR